MLWSERVRMLLLGTSHPLWAVPSPIDGGVVVSTPERLSAAQRKYVCPISLAHRTMLDGRKEEFTCKSCLTLRAASDHVFCPNIGMLPCCPRGNIARTFREDAEVLRYVDEARDYMRHHRELRRRERLKPTAKADQSDGFQ